MKGLIWVWRTWGGCKGLGNGVGGLDWMQFARIGCGRQGIVVEG